MFFILFLKVDKHGREGREPREKKNFQSESGSVVSQVYRSQRSCARGLTVLSCTLAPSASDLGSNSIHQLLSWSIHDCLIPIRQPMINPQFFFVWQRTGLPCLGQTVYFYYFYPSVFFSIPSGCMFYFYFAYLICFL
jgi:hypothetical protein